MLHSQGRDLDNFFFSPSTAGGTGLNLNASEGCAWSCSSKSLLKRLLISSDDLREVSEKEDN